MTKREEPCEKFAAHKPKVGDLVVYQGREAGRVTRVEGGLCWHTGGGPFIWCFSDGVNALHDWPSRAGAVIARCPGFKHGRTAEPRAW